MANRRVTDLDPIATAPISGVMHFVDTTDNTQNAAGSSFKVTKEDFLKENTAAILLNTAKVGISVAQAAEIEVNNAKVGITTNQSNAIVLNTAKTGITTGQASAIVLNTAKVGFTDALVNANANVTANTAKVGISTGQASAITVNTAKVGISTAQASAITDNTAAIIANQTFIADFSFTEKTPTATGSNGVYTWEIPSATKQIEVWAVSAGRGGGSGVRGAVSTQRDGGAGGSSGGIQNATFSKTDITTTNILTITTPDGGLGGEANTVDSSATNPGISGGNSILAGNVIIVTAIGASGNNINTGNLFNPNQGANSNGGKQNFDVITQGGSGGGSISPTNNGANGANCFNGTAFNLLGTEQGGNGGAGNNAGGNGGSAQIKSVKYGGSGSGGGANLSGVGGTGGAGFRGGGGGGGGASANGNLSGAGGKGGSGFIRVILYF